MGLYVDLYLRESQFECLDQFYGIDGYIRSPVNVREVNLYRVDHLLLLWRTFREQNLFTSISGIVSVSNL